MKKFLFVLFAILLTVTAAHAAEDSDFIGTWVAKTMSTSEWPIEFDVAALGMDTTFEITEDKIISNSNGEIEEVEWIRKDEDTISAITESGSLDLRLRFGALVATIEAEDGTTATLKLYRPDTACDCAALWKQIEDLTAQLEALQGKESN